MRNKYVDGSLAKAKAARNIPPVWMIIPSFYPAIGGAEVQVRELSKAFMAQGRPVQVLTRRQRYAHGEDLPARDVVENIPLIRVNTRGSGFASIPYTLSALYHLILHGRGAIYHAHDIGADGWVAVIAGHLLRGHSIIKLRTGRVGFEERLRSKLARWQFTRLLHLADRVVVVNKEVEEMVTGLGIPERRVIRIPNGVDTRHFYPPSSKNKEETRQRFGLPADKAITVYVGRLVPVKGLDILLQGWALLPEDLRTRVLLLVVGGGPERERLAAMIQSLGLKESVMLTGEQQDVRDYYWAADLFVLPSRSEGLSGALLEAMACGLPVVVSNVGGALDLVEDDHGVMFKSGDHQELAQKLLAILKEEQCWPEMGARARQAVKDYADLNVVMHRLLDLYRQLA